jgi:DNA-binding NarL/FixJ family response regulator
LVLSIHPEEQYALRTLKAGASGFLNKASAPEELITAIRKVAQGAKYITSTLAEQLVQNLDDDEQKPHQRLSNREYQVMTLIASGKTVKEIAGSLHISIKTVSTYRTRILEKMNFKNNAHIMHYSIKNNLI